jgi:hypothetical protein
MTSRLLLTRTVLVLVLGSLSGCAVLSDSDDAPSTAAETGEPSTAPPTSPTAPTTANATSPTGEPSSPTSGSPTGAPTRPAIRTTKTFYFGQPFETIRIPGTYDGIERATRLRLQVRAHGSWRTYPLPVLTSDSGRFNAYVELALGQYRARLVDPATGQSSKAVTVLVF